MTDVQTLVQQLPPSIAAHMKQHDKVWRDLPPAVRDWPNLPDNARLGSGEVAILLGINGCLLYTSPSPRDRTRSRMPSSA